MRTGKPRQNHTHVSYRKIRTTTRLGPRQGSYLGLNGITMEETRQRNIAISEVS
jgi:hypothetical protein